nr:ribonuclease H-like domain, reverse transcriptase, RNA-dependent DNA polymerase [Tanacetum cinerariifolium]
MDTLDDLQEEIDGKILSKGEIKKLEIELWNLKVKGNDVGGYTQRFQELALMCTKFLSDETKKVDKYISGLPDNIHGNVMSARPKTLDFSIELASDLMDQKLRTYAERQVENKRKLDNNNQDQQQLLKKQNVVQAYVVGSGEKKPYEGSKPMCPKCNYHYNGECAPKCTNCKKVSHLTKDCWHPTNANNQRTITCYECGNQGHYRSDCPMLKNQSKNGVCLRRRRNQSRHWQHEGGRGVCLPTTGFEDPDFPYKVYKVEKTLYGLRQASRAWYETLSTYLLDNGFKKGHIDKTLFIKRNKGDILLAQVYVDDIVFGSTKKEMCDSFEILMHEKFQISSMGELTFFLGLQVKQKKEGIFNSHDKYVAEILKNFGFSDVKKASTPMETSKPLLKDEDGEEVDDSPFDLVAYTDSDYAGASLDRKSTTGECQFLECRLILWQCKKQIMVENSTTKAEYVAPSNYCQVKPVNDDVRLQALTDGKKVVINEACIRHDLKLNDAEGTLCLSNAVIFKELARIGAKTTSRNEFNSTMASAITCLANNQKFNFSKYILDNLKKNLEASVPFNMFPRFIQVFVNHQLGDLSHYKGIFVNPSLTKKVFANLKRVGTGFSGAVTPLFGTMMVQALEEVGDLPTDVQDAPIPDAPSSSQHQRKHKFRKKEMKETKVSHIEINTMDHVPTTSNDPLPSDEDRMKLKELIDLCIVLSMQDVDVQSERIEDVVKEVAKEMVEVMDIAMIIVDEVSTDGGELNAANEKPVSAALTNITNAQPSEATKTTVDITTAPKAKGIVFHDKDESITKTAFLKSQVKDKGKAKLVEELEILKSRKAQIALDEEVARRIKTEKAQRWIQKGLKLQERELRKEKAEKDQPAKKQKGDELEKDNAKKQKLKEQEEAKELKKNLEIVPDDEDDVFVNVTPLSSKPLTIMDYKIYKEGKKEHFQIIRANGNHQMYLAFSTVLKNFNREYLEVLWKIVKDRSKKSQPKEVLDVCLWYTLKVMFEHSVEDNV